MLTKDKPKTEVQSNKIIAPAAKQESAKTASPIIKIKPIECYNDNIALLLFENESGEGLELPENMRYSDEGIVIGVGPGVPNATGRTPPHCKIGDTVIIDPRSGKNPHDGASASFYAGKRIVFTIERNLICKSAIQRQFEVV